MANRTVLNDYRRTTWVDEKTPVEQVSLNKIENQLVALTRVCKANNSRIRTLEQNYTALSKSHEEALDEIVRLKESVTNHMDDM